MTQNYPEHSPFVFSSGQLKSFSRLRFFSLSFLWWEFLTSCAGQGVNLSMPSVTSPLQSIMHFDFINFPLNIIPRIVTINSLSWLPNKDKGNSIARARALSHVRLGGGRERGAWGRFSNRGVWPHICMLV